MVLSNIRARKNEVYFLSRAFQTRNLKSEATEYHHFLFWMELVKQLNQIIRYPFGIATKYMSSKGILFKFHEVCFEISY
jgi:hypothetical protein